MDVLARSVLKTSNYGLFGIPVNAQDWTGGASLNGVYGVAGMHLVSEVGSLEGRKSWFMFDNEVVALGAGISMTEERAAETVVENRNSLKSLYVDGVLKPSTKGWSEALPSPRWISLEGTGGYYFPQPSTVNAKRDYNGFTQLYFDHGTSPENEGYAYVLLPSSTREETEAYAARPEIEVVCNTDNIQAVRETGLRVMGINFWQAGQVDDIVCDAPAAVMVREDRGMLYVSLADPTWKQTSVRLSLAGSYRMTGEDGRVRLEANGDRTDVVFDVTDRMGQCIEVSLADNDYSGLDEGRDDGPVYVWERGSATAIVRNMEPGGRVVVYDARGRLCRVATAVLDELRMDFSGYGKGVYVIRYCRPDGRSYVWKFVNM
ncbi:hyaluronate lyase [Tannerella sp. CAG:118]|nr:hyaluronate lyase [Tannerella sp. CAG:118]